MHILNASTEDMNVVTTFPYLSIVHTSTYPVLITTRCSARHLCWFTYEILATLVEIYKISRVRDNFPMKLECK